MPFAAALLGHGILLTHGNRGVVGDIAQLLDSGRDFIDGLNRSWRRLFDRHDVPRDFLGGLAGLWGKAFDLLGHHKPRPASPARAASIVALRASRFVCAAMLLMRSLTSPISSTDAERLSTASVIAFASLVAWLAIVAEFATRVAICSIDWAISSAAVATIPTFVVACSDAAEVARACS